MLELDSRIQATFNGRPASEHFIALALCAIMTQLPPAEDGPFALTDAAKAEAERGKRRASLMDAVLAKFAGDVPDWNRIVAGKQLAWYQGKSVQQLRTLGYSDESIDEVRTALSAVRWELPDQSERERMAEDSAIAATASREALARAATQRATNAGALSDPTNPNAPPGEQVGAEGPQPGAVAVNTVNPGGVGVTATGGMPPINPTSNHALSVDPTAGVNDPKRNQPSVDGTSSNPAASAAAGAPQTMQEATQAAAGTNSAALTGDASTATGTAATGNAADGEPIDLNTARVGQLAFVDLRGKSDKDLQKMNIGKAGITRVRELEALEQTRAGKSST